MEAVLLKALQESTFEEMGHLRPYAKGVIYGPYGAGKTVLAAEMAQRITPEGKSIIYIDSIENWTSLLNHPGLRQNMKRVKFQGVSQIEAIGKAMKEGVGGFEKVGTVIIDELDTVATHNLDVVVKVSLQNGMRSGKDSMDPDDITRPEYGRNTVRIRRVMRELLQLDINIIIICHESEYAPEGKPPSIRPSLSPKLCIAIFDYMAFVVRMTAKVAAGANYTREIQSHPTGFISTKTRVGGLPVITGSTQFVEAVYEWMQGKREDVEVPAQSYVTREPEVDEEESHSGIVVE